MLIKSIYAFYYSAKYNSFSKAAEILETSQPNISAQIKKIESDLNIKLFERKQGRVTLSNHGEKLYKNAEKIVEEYRDFLNNSQKLTEKKPITIVTQPRLYDRYVEPVIVPKLFENSSIHIRTGELFAVKAWVENEEADILITEGIFDDNRNYQKIKQLDMLYFSWAKSAEFTFTHPIPTITHSRVWDHWHNLTTPLTNNINFERVMTIDTPNFSKKLIEKGLGIGLLPEAMIDASETLERCEGPTKSHIEGPINVYVRKGLKASKTEIINNIINNFTLTQ